MNTRIIYLAIGIMMTILSLVFLIGAIIEQTPLLYQTYSAVALSVMSFCMYSLHPHFKDKVRAKFIRQKAIFYSFLVIFLYLIFFSLGLVLDFIALSIPEMLTMISSLIVITLFISLVCATKLH
ncbi:uncharacterized membrane protein YbaN (DUF454 family) [Evansella vedderi]|uniref:Uncharacterized membrane protein YbaN (DUF454 family) n=1 Tax=Evansella vedderi TaxID=38282 RepID=A0ABT9ZNE5_9BACI|nr:permease [Evansella vedderi]MDQ0252763.1 uncharacterized membrane protein YbaN (DUF454 family) [Evansella vedderi]